MRWRDPPSFREVDWWLYNWCGNMVTTVPQTQTGLDGFASYDRTRQQVHVVFGNESGTNSVHLTRPGTT